VAELSQPFTLSPAAISKHLKVLESAGILYRVKTGKFHRFRLDTGPFTKARRLLEDLTDFWQQRQSSRKLVITRLFKHGRAEVFSATVPFPGRRAARPWLVCGSSFRNMIPYGSIARPRSMEYPIGSPREFKQEKGMDDSRKLRQQFRVGGF
jgi:hypothetical protein